MNISFQSKSRKYQEILEQREFTYDAFICYSAHDSRWVVDQLRPRLEIEDQLRLCIHQRDWIAGRDIIDNIVDSIEKSRKTVLIVSNAFARSQWCHFELTMEQSRLIRDDRDSLILVVLEEIAEQYLTTRLRLQLARRTYVEWTPDSAVGQQLFWEQLRRALATPSAAILQGEIPTMTGFVRGSGGDQWATS